MVYNPGGQMGKSVQRAGQRPAKGTGRTLPREVCKERESSCRFP